MAAGKAPTRSAPAPGPRSHAQRLQLWLSAGVGALAAGTLALLALPHIAGQRQPMGTVMAVAALLIAASLLWRSVSASRTPAGQAMQAQETDAVGLPVRALADSLADGVVITDGTHVLHANPVAARMLGAGEPGQPLAALLPIGLDAALAGAAGPLTTQLHHPDGQPFQATLNHQDAAHLGAGWHFLIIRDLSELEQGRAALAASNAELQAMAGRLFSLQEDERRSISRDLHDDIGQAITAMKLAAFAARDEDQAERRREDIDQIIELADSTVIRLRNLSMLLRPPQLDVLGLEAALRWQAGMLFRSSPVELLMDVRPLSRRPGNEVEQACFRIAQESLTNALRHAHASQVSLLLQDAPDGGLHLRVLDDGEGFDLAGPRGLGMIVMRERAQSVGGSLHIETAPGEGTCIDVRLPCPAP